MSLIHYLQPKSRKYGFIPRAYAKSPAMTSNDKKADEVVEHDVERENVSIGAEDVLESDVSDKDLSNLIHDAISKHKKTDQGIKLTKRFQFSQCGYFRIFLSLRFYVKSILKSLEVLKVPFLPFLGL